MTRKRAKVQSRSAKAQKAQMPICQKASNPHPPSVGNTNEVKEDTQVPVIKKMGTTVLVNFSGSVTNGDYDDEDSFLFRDDGEEGMAF